MPDRIRTFIAIELPEAVRVYLSKVQQQLKTKTSGIRWVAPDNIHLTLRFLGDIRRDDVELVNKVISGAATDVSPFSLSVKGIGAFPGLSRPRVVWMGLEGDLNILKGLHRGIENRLESIGFEKEKRNFKGHLTLGRVKGKVDPIKFIDAVKALRNFGTEMFPVNRVILFESDLQREGPVYTNLYSAEL